MTSYLNYFGFGGDKASSAKVPDDTPAKQSPVRALPAAWYTSPEMYELERRAIFTRRWLFMTHGSRIKNPGDFLRYTVAGYDIVINRDRAGQVHAFHNVCRHRAYPVVEKEQGNAKIFACRYHGWSYGLNGNLAKAPGYQDLDDFDKSQNNLFGIHVKVDINNFIWINMDANPTPEVPWEEHFADVDKQDRYRDFNFADYELDHCYELDGDFNWKILADNFNECYHCPTTHPDIPDFINLETFDSDVKAGHIQHHCVSTPEQAAKGLAVASTYYFPATSMTVSPHFIMIQKFLPKDALHCTMHYEIYRNTSPSSSPADFSLISSMYARVMAEDKVLCQAAQKNLNIGVFESGVLHPRYEKAPLFFQQTVREIVGGHWRREKEEGREIWVVKTGGGQEGREDMEVCEGIGCGGGKELSW
ncbi:ISP domain-containing protein [Aureobasidium sp. EXF-10728]|nr:ISP domain-containing protein [Aureobasidium sp. EXF-10728]